MTKSFKEILQKGVTYLKNIETMMDERIEKLKIAKESLDRIDNSLESQLSNITQSGFSELISTISYQFESAKPKIEKLARAQTMIIDTVKQLTSDMKIYSTKELLKKVEELEKIDFNQPVVTQVIEVAATTPIDSTLSSKKTPLSAPIPTVSPVLSPKTQVSALESVTEDLDLEDIRESELEGAKIFETIITGWKRRDWEKIGGTKEMFIWAWAKLSNFDRQKIKNGTWSKQIMNKCKLLGRERK